MTYLPCIQLNLSTTVILKTEESDHCREVAVVEKQFKEEAIYGLSAKKKWPLGRGSR